MLEAPSAGQKQRMSRIASPASATCSGGLVSIIIPTYHEAAGYFCRHGWNFVLNRRVSFSDTRHGRSIFHQYFLWLAFTALGAAISWSVAVGLNLLNKFFAAHVFLSATLGIVAGSLANFTFARYWVFTARSLNESREIKHRPSHLGLRQSGWSRRRAWQRILSPLT